MADEQLPEDAEQADITDTEEPSTDETEDNHDEPGEFPRSYVEELRQENGRYRQRAQRADQLAQRLHTELVRATGRLADPTDLEFNETHLDNPAGLDTALTELLERKPHLASRRPSGDIGQGASVQGATVDLAAMMRQRAG